MGLWDKIRGEFIDIIEWLDSSNDTMVFRFDRHGNEIKYGAKLVVRESQAAVFINEGQLADVFAPGTYTLETQNVPILSTLKGWKHGFESPFKAEVYFVNTKRFTDLKWGTKNPVMLRDPEFGPVRIRMFGSYCVRNGFDDILVLASNSLPAKYAEKLEPWDLGALVPYKHDYLSGFRSETYQIDLEGGFEVAKNKMDGPIRSTIANDIAGGILAFQILGRVDVREWFRPFWRMTVSRRLASFAIAHAYCFFAHFLP